MTRPRITGSNRTVLVVGGAVAVGLGLLLLRGGGGGGNNNVNITNLQVKSGAAYRLDELELNKPAYIDRSYSFTGIPNDLFNAAYIITANDDKDAEQTNFISFEVDQAVTVLIAYDSRATNLPAWLADWDDTGSSLSVSDTDGPGRDLFARDFPAGTVSLGGNRMPPSEGASSMYSVIVISAGGGPGPTEPAIDLNPAQGQPGDDVDINGQNFPANAVVNINFGGTNLGDVDSNQDGDFLAQVTVPNLAPGNVTVRCQAGNVSATATFQLQGSGNQCPDRNIPNAPYRSSRHICGMTFNKSTHQKEAVGSDNWPLSWMDNDDQITSWGDGEGQGGSSNGPRRASLGIARVSGAHNNYTIRNVNGGVNPESGNRTWDADGNNSGKTYGIIMIDGVLYMWVTPGSGPQGFNEFRLWRSTNRGHDWQRQGSWRFTKSEGFVKPNFVQFGKNYAGARDNFVYSHVIELQNDNDLVVQKPGRIHLMRANINDLWSSKNNWEFFTGTSSNPSWGSINSSRSVFDDNRGVGWNTSCVYIPGLNRYILMTEHDSSHQSNVGIFDAPEPWGPWTTVEYFNNWQNTRSGNRGMFHWEISRKWLRNNDRDFTIVFTGGPGGQEDSWNSMDGKFLTP